MRRIVLTFGLISGGIMGAMMLVATVFQDQIGFDRGAIVGYTSMVAAFLMVFFGVRAYRDQVGGGAISFGRAFGVGMLIVTVGTVCYVATWELVYRKLSPDFMDKYARYELEKARAAGASAEQLTRQTEQMRQFAEMYKNPLVSASLTFLEPLPVGLVMTLVAAGALRRRRGEGESPGAAAA